MSSYAAENRSLFFKNRFFVPFAGSSSRIACGRVFQRALDASSRLRFSVECVSKRKRRRLD
jgi:hypothetical protein